MSQIIQTTRQDLPDWAQPIGGAGMQHLIEMLFNRPELDANGNDFWKQDPNGPFKNKTKLDLSGGGKTYDKIGGPLEPQATGFSGLENTGRTMAVNEVKEGQPIRDASDQWMLDTLGGNSSQLARMMQAYTMGGPVAGASRAGLMSALTGNAQGFSEQAMIDSMFGKSSNLAENSAYNQLGDERDLARDASISNYAGRNAGAARKSALDTIEGRYLGPDSNPFLRANAKAAGRSLADTYRYATAPGIDADFARAGSFGGSANQQTKDMAKFGLGQNLADLENQMFGDNYQRERGNQLSVTGSERDSADRSLESERGRQQQTQQQLLQQKLAAALDERGGWRSILDNSLTRGTSMAEGELGRGVQAQSLLPELMKSRMFDADVLRSLGAEGRQLEDSWDATDYRNKMTKFQWPFQLMNIFNAQLGSSTGGQGVTTQTSTNPNAVSPLATGIGGATAGLGLLSQMGSFFFPSSGGGAPSTGAG